MTIIGIVAFIGFILGFGFLVFVHELGHFLVAKWVGIKCTQFAIGFGPSVVSWRKGIGFRAGSTEGEYEQRIRDHLKSKGVDPAHVDDELHASETDANPEGEKPEGHSFTDQAGAELGLGETEYRLNYVPLGGYVKMLGQEDIDPAARSADPRSFNTKPIWARACVISAGVIMNVIIGWIFFVIAFSSGVKFPPAIVGAVAPDMPAAQTYAQDHDNDPADRGLRVGDRITHIDGKVIEDMMEVRLATALGAPDHPLKLRVERPGRDAPLHFTMTPEPNDQNGLRSIGVAPPFTLEVQALAEDGDVYQAGVRPGMRLVEIDGRQVHAYHEYYEALGAAKGEPVEATFAEKAEDGTNGKRVTVQLRAKPLFQRSADGLPHLAGFVPPTHIGHVAEDSPAEQAGVQAGDLIVRLGDVTWPALPDVFRTVKAADGEPIAMTVQRDGEQVQLGPIAPDDNKLGIGISPPDAPIVGRALAGSPANALDLPGGSRLVTINGEPVNDWADVQRILGSLDAPEQGETRAVPVTYELNVANRPTEESTLTLSASALRAVADARWSAPPLPRFTGRREAVVAGNPWEATKLGAEKTVQFIANTYLTILRLFQRTVQIDDLHGPVGIVDKGVQITQQGWQYALFFLALISVNLAVINFLPIPIVDGGHMLFLLIEKIKGSPVSANVQAIATYAGLALIGLLFIVVTYNDIMRLG